MPPTVSRSLQKKILIAVIAGSFCASLVVAIVQNSVYYRSINLGIYRQALGYFAGQVFVTLLLSAILFLVISKLMTRHLLRIANYIESFDFKNLPADLTLNRRSSGRHADELDVLVKAINGMRANLVISYEELNRFNKELEIKVEEKTNIIIEQGQKLEYSAKMTALGEMAAGIAHEINNPLAVIKLKADQLAEVISDQPIDIDSVKVLCHTIGETTSRTAAIVQGLRSFARDSANDDFRPTALNTLIEDTVVLCQERLRHRDVALELASFTAAPKVECNQVQISQVLLNLINNAVDAIGALQDKWIRVDWKASGEHIEIGVTDSGSGIPAEIRAKIMQPFFTTKEIGKGTGLGLSISRDIVQTHGGEFFVDSACANTRFVVKLPIKQSRVKKAAAA